jgi:hypothetical protein
MLYWLGVYLLVVISVAAPFLLLYLVGLVVWLAAGAIGSTKKILTNALAVRKGFSRAHWSAIWRKAA